MSLLLTYYPLLFLLFFVICLFILACKYAQVSNKQTKEEQERARMQYNLDRLMNNQTGNCDEIEIVKTMSQYQFNYHPTK